MLFPAMPVGSKMTCLQEAGSFMTACTTWMIRKAGHPFLGMTGIPSVCGESPQGA